MAAWVLPIIACGARRPQSPLLPIGVQISRHHVIRWPYLGQERVTYSGSLCPGRPRWLLGRSRDMVLSSTDNNTCFRFFVDSFLAEGLTLESVGDQVGTNNSRTPRRARTARVVADTCRGRLRFACRPPRRTRYRDECPGGCAIRSPCGWYRRSESPSVHRTISHAAGSPGGIDLRC